MSLTRKLTDMICLVVLLSAALGLVVQQVFFKPSFLALEKATAIRHAERATVNLLLRATAAQATGNPKGLSHTARTLKSSATNPGAEALVVRCGGLEMHVRKGRLDDASELVDAARVGQQRAAEELRELSGLAA